MASKSYAWSTRLAEEVADAGTIEVPTPGFNTPENYKTDETGIVVDGHVMAPEQASVVWDGEFKSATVTNSSGKPWHPAQTLYLTVPGKITSTSDAGEALEALANQVAGLTTQQAATDAKVTALEGQVSGLDARVAALEAAGGAAAAAGATAAAASGPDKARAKHRGEDEAKHDEEHSSVKRDEKAEQQHGEHAKRDEDKKHKDAPGTPHWDDKKKK